ncbi:histone deacetylase family protein [Rhizophagus clarus]|uniref:Histone deacetylase family protein n=1 Tax=Rhizophagus clarus TaxID=94130 RepID=A0A8H3M533_9GLOM|nr:histone deacetylase family protein [Rhizophagus clarus]
MKVFYSNVCLKHAPKHEIISGNLIDYLESPSRLIKIKEYLDSLPIFDFVSPIDNGLDPILSVHPKDYVEYLQTAYDEWVNIGGNKDGILPEAFLHHNMSSSSSIKRDVKVTSPIAKAGLYCSDLSCCITKDTWESAYESAQVVISAALELKRFVEESSEKEMNPLPGIFALCRPPGHHANSNVCSGYCFLNNAAISTNILKKDNKKVVILDIDYHHGNGTQDIFYLSSNPLYVSLHGSPDYPWFTGNESEKGEGEGEGFNVNIPLSKDTDDDEYLKKLKKVIYENINPYNADYLIVSLGVDTYKDDIIGGLQITSEGYKRMGELIKSINLPTLFVMEVHSLYNEASGEFTEQIYLANIEMVFKAFFF